MSELEGAAAEPVDEANLQPGMSVDGKIDEGVEYLGAADGAPAETVETFRYDAFISYSHDQKELAAGLQKTLHQLGRKWYQLRRLNVFRDVENLTVGGHLPAVLERAVKASRYLVLLASERSARSRWVELECRTWLAAGGDPDHLIIVLADGEIPTSLPPCLREMIDENWLFADVRTLPSGGGHGRVFDAAAAISARIQGIDKSDLIGEDRRNRQKAFRRLASLVAAAVLLAVATGIFAVFTVVARSDAERQRDTAASRAAANVSRSLRGANPELARNLAVGSYRVSPTNEAISALIEGMDAPARIELPGRAFQAELGPDAKVLALKLRQGDGDAVRSSDAILRLSGGRGVMELPGTLDDNDQRAFSPDERLLATADGDGHLQLWDLTTSPPRLLGRVEEGSEAQGASPVFSPSGNLLAVSRTDGSVRLYDVTDPRHARLTVSWTLPLEVTRTRFSDDGSLLAFGLIDGRIALADIGDGASLRSAFTAHDGPVFDLAFSRDGTLLVSAGQDEMTRVWSTERAGSRPLIAETHGGASGEFGMAFAGAGRTLLVNGDGGPVTVSSLDDPTGLASSTTIVGSAVAMDAAGRLLATVTNNGEKAVLHIWNIDAPHTPRRLRDISLAEDPSSVGAFSADGKTLYIAGDKAVDAWDLSGVRNPLGVATVQDHSAEVTTAQLIGGGRRLLTSSPDGATLLYDTTNPARPILLGRFESVRADGLAAISPDGRRVAVEDRIDHVALFELAATGPRAIGGVEVDGPIEIAFDRTGAQLAVGRWDGKVMLLNVSPTPTRTALFDAGTGIVTTLRFLGGDGRQASTDIVVGGYEGIARWRISADVPPALVGQSIEHIIVTDIDFDDDRDLLVSSDNRGVVSIWDLHADRLDRLARVEVGVAVRSVALTAGSSRLVAGLENGVIVLVSVADPHHPSRLGDLVGHGEAVNDLAVGPDGLLVSASNDHSVMIWKADPADMAAYICATSRSQLTRQQWDQYISEVPFRITCGA